MTEARGLVTVHAHPDDESHFGAGTVARYHHAGVRTVLVTCTDGSLGHNQNLEVGPIGDLPGIVEIRRKELEEAAAIVGYDEVVRLEYPDSGPVRLRMDERSPESFARIPLDGPVRRVVEVLRRERPQVVVTYADDQRAYAHPDHLRAHEVAVAAFDAAGDPAAYPEAGPAWQPLKLYYVISSGQRRRAINARYAELGKAPASTDTEIELAPDEGRVTTRVDVTPFAHVWIDGVRAHRCQLGPARAAILDLPDAVVAEIYGEEDYILARDLTTSDGPVGAETDLFARVG